LPDYHKRAALALHSHPPIYSLRSSSIPKPLRKIPLFDKNLLSPKKLLYSIPDPETVMATPQTSSPDDQSQKNQEQITFRFCREW
jgi:hypothetical protein